MIGHQIFREITFPGYGGMIRSYHVSLATIAAATMMYGKCGTKTTYSA
jgi:hypothetical protein